MNTELQNYIQSARAAHETDEIIKAKLTEAGWNEGAVDSALRAQAGNTHTEHQVFGDQEGFHACGHTFPYVLTGVACLLISFLLPALALLDIELFDDLFNQFDFDGLLVFLYLVALGALVVGLLIVTTILFHVVKVSRPIFSKSLFVVGATSLPAFLLFIFDESSGYIDYSQALMFLPFLLMLCVYVMLMKYITEKSLGFAIGLCIVCLAGVFLLGYGVFLVAPIMF